MNTTSRAARSGAARINAWRTSCNGVESSVRRYRLPSRTLANARGATSNSPWTVCERKFPIRSNSTLSKLVDKWGARPQDFKPFWHKNRPWRGRGVFIALGSNVGDRLDAIESACRAIDEDERMRVIRTSQLYETKAMYVEDQGHFLNGVCEIETDYSPIELLDKLQWIEQDMGRVKLIDKGPRNIDLDILFYRNEDVKTERLTIPHPLIQEREFVLRPLSDMYRILHQCGDFRPLKNLNEIEHDETMKQYTPLGNGLPTIDCKEPTRKTLIMSILNTTPDSFSDGGKHSAFDVQALQKLAASHIAAGATIIDIGGQSSRPNAEDVTVEEEISRILPAIEAIKSLPEAKNIAISVDTYRAAVAEAAIKAGAHIINDVSAGLLDKKMFPTIGRLGCTYIMMHMRGTPATMQNTENTTYKNGVTEAVRNELTKRIYEAQSHGIRAWRIITDPGVGFAKTPEQNLEILRHDWADRKQSQLMPFPTLIGTSRKGFIKHFTGVENPEQRVWGTAATVCAAIQNGADIVRVHDIAEMAQVAKMADALYRISEKPRPKRKKGIRSKEAEENDGDEKTATYRPYRD